MFWGAQKNRLIEMFLLSTRPQQMFWLRNKKKNFQLHTLIKHLSLIIWLNTGIKHRNIKWTVKSYLALPVHDLLDKPRVTLLLTQELGLKMGFRLYKTAGKSCLNTITLAKWIRESRRGNVNKDTQPSSQE